MHYDTENMETYGPTLSFKNRKALLMAIAPSAPPKNLEPVSPWLPPLPEKSRASAPELSSFLSLGWDPWRRRGSCSSPRESRRGSVRPSRRHLLARSARPLGSCRCRRGVRAPPRPLGVVVQGARQEDAFFDSAWARWCCASALPPPELRSRRR